MREKCPYLEFHWSKLSQTFTGINSAQVQENTDQKHFQYGHFSRSDTCNIAMTNATIFTKNRPPFHGLSHSFVLFF